MVLSCCTQTVFHDFTQPKKATEIMTLLFGFEHAARHVQVPSASHNASLF